MKNVAMLKGKMANLFPSYEVVAANEEEDSDENLFNAAEERNPTIDTY